MTMFLVGLGLAIVIGFWYLSRFPKTYQVVRSISINKPIADVYNYVLDFSKWTSWSPWYIHEPEAKISFQNASTSPGGTYAWDGKKIGAGSMTHVSTTQNTVINIDLRFLRPFKSLADVRFDFKEANGQTLVTWTLESQMPIFMRPFQNFFAMMIGHDFDLGLAFLNGALDPASEHPRLTFDGKVTTQTQTYLAQSYTGTFEGMRAAMQTGYPTLWSQASSDAPRVADAPAIAAYHKVKPMKGWTQMDMGVAVSKVNAGEQGLTLAGGNYFQTTMKGKYDFLGHVWNAAYGQAKMQKLKVDHSRAALEVYVLNPMHAQNSNEWETRLLVPIKG